MDQTTNFFMNQSTVAEEIAPVCGEKYNPNDLIRGDLSLPALLTVVASYLVILVLGTLASYIKTGKWKVDNSEEHTVGNRNIGLVIGVFTMTATWVGGGYINGTSEGVFNPYTGLVWTQPPWALSLSLIFGGLLFAKMMRQQRYVTILDPFTQKYGRVMAGLLYFPEVMGQIFYVAGILGALGATLSVIAGLRNVWAMLISAAVVVFYTIMGGLYSVAYTDVLQLILVVVGLWLCVPFALLNDAVTSITETSTVEGGWLGVVPPDYSISLYIDTGLLLIFGGIPWQEYFQRVLSQKTPQRAQILSFVAGFLCMVVSIPSILIGAIASSADWNATDYKIYGCIPIPETDYPLALPLVMRYLVPETVAIIGLGAVSAAVMSSADSSLLCASAMFARHIYAPITDAIRPRLGSDRKVTERETMWVLRITIIIAAALATVMALVVKSIIGLWYLGADLVYAILFPELILVLYMKGCNSYGAFVGYCVGLVVRLLSGEPLIGLPAVIKFPWYDEVYEQQYFPFKTLIMLITLVTIILVSYIAKFLFVVCGLPKKMDIFECFCKEKNEAVGDFDNVIGKVDAGFDNPEFSKKA